MESLKQRLLLTRSRITDIHGRQITPNGVNRVIKPNHILERQGSLTDVGSFQEFTFVQNEVYDVVRFVRRGTPLEQLNLQQLSFVSFALYGSPIYLALRRNNPIPENHMPPVFIDLVRAVAGINLVLDGISHGNTDVKEYWSPQHIYDYGNGHNSDGPSGKGKNYFTREGSLSCPAPETVIKKMLTEMIYASQDNSPRSSNFDIESYLSKDELYNLLVFGYNYVALQSVDRTLSSDSSLSFIQKIKLGRYKGELEKTVSKLLGY